MSEKNEKKSINMDVIALPPLKMVLVYAKEERMNRTRLASDIEKDVIQSTTKDEHLEQKDLKKIIEHLEKKS